MRVHTRCGLREPWNPVSFTHRLIYISKPRYPFQSEEFTLQHPLFLYFFIIPSSGNKLKILDAKVYGFCNAHGCFVCVCVNERENFSQRNL